MTTNIARNTHQEKHQQEMRVLMHVKQKEHLSSSAAFYSALCLFLPPELEGRLEDV